MDKSGREEKRPKFYIALRAYCESGIGKLVYLIDRNNKNKTKPIHVKKHIQRVEILCKVI